MQEAEGQVPHCDLCPGNVCRCQEEVTPLAAESEEEEELEDQEVEAECRREANHFEDTCPEKIKVGKEKEPPRRTKREPTTSELFFPDEKGVDNFPTGQACNFCKTEPAEDLGSGNQSSGGGSPRGERASWCDNAGHQGAGLAACRPAQTPSRPATLVGSGTGAGTARRTRPRAERC